MVGFARMRRWLIISLLLLTGNALASDPCPALAARQTDAQVATRLAAIACAEHQRWNRPFIDADGRLASLTVHEAEAAGLQDGGAPWRRVAQYWLDSGLLASMAFKPGVGDCQYAARNSSAPGFGCRSFIVDNPWSAAFISWLMQRAGVPRFRSSATHFDYVRAARKDVDTSPYAFVDPWATPPAQGDLLCYVRSRRLHGHAGLAKIIDGGTAGLPMHCDLIVAVDAGRAWAIGGNVQQAVAMRMFNLDAQGLLHGLPQRSEEEAACSPAAPEACNFNRQDWAVLLRLKPQSALAQLGSVTPSLLPDVPAPSTCCVNCVLGSGVPRCPVAGQVTVPSSSDAPLQGSE